jgi:predicted component of type VI protein secretion system
MMITFRIIEPQDLPPDLEKLISFDTQGGKIGRLSTPNDWVLDNNLVSGEHATIEYREDGYYIVDHSSNGTSIQSLDQPEAEYFHNKERKLNDRDILYIGDYDIEVTIEPDEPLPPEPSLGDAQEPIGAKVPTVRLDIIEPQYLPPDQKSHITFDTQGGKIGRLSTHNDWALADDEHFVSTEHATIQYRNDGYYIVDHSSNGTGIQSSDMPEPEDFHDDVRKLNDGDILYIDKYEIKVTLENRNHHSIPKYNPIHNPTLEPPTGSTITRGPLPPEPPGPLGDPQETIGAKVPTVRLDIIEPQDLPLDQKSHITFDTQGGTIGRLSTHNDWALADDEHFVSTEHATIEYREDGYYIVDHSSNGTGIQSPGMSEPEYFHNEERKLNDGDILYIEKYEIKVTLEERNLHPIPKPKPIPKPTPEVPTGSTITRGPKTSTHTPNESCEQPKPLPGDVQEAIAAFLEGAGVANIPIEQLDPDLMRTLGKAFRETMAGLIKLLDARKRFKIGADLEATIFKAGLNNPLNINQDPSMVLEIMLLKKNGYLPMLDSIQDAFEKTEAHLLAMGSGITNSLENTLARFSPREIERFVEQKHKFKLFNPDSQKWKEFVRRYNEDSEINTLLSEELAQAYEEQIRHLNFKNQQRGH